MECEKCGYNSQENKEKQGKPICSICNVFAPKDEEVFETYMTEKLDGSQLETFRKHHVPINEKKKQGMVDKAIKGNLMSRAPFGYKIDQGKLIPAENHSEIEEIFEEFLHSGDSLNKISQRHKLSVNGLKKILKNFTYIGKIKFNNQIYEGHHQPLISSTLFNHVQNKLEKLGIN